MIIPRLVVYTTSIMRRLSSVLRTRAKYEDVNSESVPTPADIAVLSRRLMQLAEAGHADALKAALAAAPAGVVDRADEHGFTALMHACTEGHGAAARILLAYGASVNLGNSHRETALHLASSLGHSPIVQLLLEHGADAQLLTASGATAAGLAESVGHHDIASMRTMCGGGGGGSSSREQIDGTIPKVSLAELPRASASRQADARDAAYALLECEVADLTTEGLNELDTILRMMLERIDDARAAGAAAAIPEVITPRLAAPMEQRRSSSSAAI